MIAWKELKERRITQVVFTYLAVGWVVLTAFDQLADRDVLSELAYRLALLVYIAGIPVSLILGWYHGEKGRQRVAALEIVLVGIIFFGTAGAAVAVVNDYRQDQSAVAPWNPDSGFDARRVAVLYFEDLSAEDGALSHVADGLTEALIAELSRVRALDVISRNGVAPYRDATVPPDSVARALGAGSVIDGSVEPAGDRLRVNVRLLDGQSGAHIDRDAFSLPRDELLAVRDSVVQRAARFLRSRLGDEVRMREWRAETRNVEAWTQVQRAERLRKEAEQIHAGDPDEARTLLDQADQLLRFAEALDGEWVHPIVMRARIALLGGTWDRGDRSYEAAQEAIRAGIRHADRALERDPGHAEALEARGALRYLRWTLNVSPTPAERAVLLDQAQRDLERAVEADPSLASALNTLSHLHYQRKDRISAALAARQALRADAYLSDADHTLNRLFWAHYDLGQFAEAGRTCTEGTARFPEDVRFKQCQLWMMITPTGQPDPDAAWRLLAEVDSLTPPQPRPLVHRVGQMIVGGVLARAGMPDSARRVLADARAGPTVDPEQELYGYEAIMRTLLGDYDEATRRLKRYVSANPHHAFLEVEGDLHWWWRPLRHHPEFDDVAASGS